MHPNYRGFLAKTQLVLIKLKSHHYYYSENVNVLWYHPPIISLWPAIRTDIISCKDVLLHGIIELTEWNSDHVGPRAALWEIVRVFKATTSYQIRHAENRPWFAWQDDYDDEVLRTEAALQQARRYILENPTQWTQDRLFQRF